MHRSAPSPPAFQRTMKTLAIALVAACSALACTSPTPAPPTEPTPAVRNVRFTCTNGEWLSVRFFTEEARAILTRNGQDIALQQQPSGSGFIYSNGPNTIRGKGQDLTVEIGRRVPLQCQAR